jgi:hypothetical protein
MKSLVTINFIEHIRNNKVIWRAENIKNMIHLEGREFLVKTAFSNNGSLVPDNYYLGLDARDDLVEDDTLSSLLDEPYQNGYLRQLLPSNGTGFAITETSGVYKALSNIITFSASELGWGPVKNMFLTTESDNSGILISSLVLTSPVTTVAGDTISVQIALSLQDI